MSELVINEIKKFNKIIFEDSQDPNGQYIVFN